MGQHYFPSDDEMGEAFTMFGQKIPISATKMVHLHINGGSINTTSKTMHTFKDNVNYQVPALKKMQPLMIYVINKAANSNNLVYLQQTDLADSESGAFTLISFKEWITQVGFPEWVPLTDAQPADSLHFVGQKSDASQGNVLIGQLIGYEYSV